MRAQWIHFIISLGLLISVHSFAEKMDLDTHTAMIDRLRTIVQDLDDSDVSKSPSTLRLADLLSERSRLKGFSEVEKNCDNCLKSREDRAEALGYYTQVLSKLSGSQRSNAMLQKAHLHLSLGQLSETEKIFLLITKEGTKKHSPLILGQTYGSLADVYFQKSDFKKAKKEYEKALAIAETPQKGLIHYRLAWCLLNLEQITPAIHKLEMILQTPTLTEIQTADGIVQDESFKTDVAKDLATFYARSHITQETIDKLVSLSPASEKQQNLFFLGTEADRLGKKKESALVWLTYLKSPDQKKDVLNAQIRLMKLKRDLGDLPSSMIAFNNVKSIWEDQGCGKNCDIHQKEIRRWLIDWNREEKKTQSKELTQAYITYTQMFPHDDEMYLLGASAAQQRHQYKSAFDLYRSAAIESAFNLKSNKDEKAVEKLKHTLETSLVGEMDMAETLKNPELRLQAYNHYLDINPQGKERLEVKFQIAKVYFENKKYDQSANAFRNIALENPTNPNSLQKDAASLSLESLIQLKDDKNIEKWSFEYSQIFKKQKEEFLTLNRKSVMNTTASRINQKAATEEDLLKLKMVSMNNIDDKEKIKIYKNRYLLAVQLKNYKDAKFANAGLLGFKSLSQTERTQALEDKIWLSELVLDFKESYDTTLSLPGPMTAERALKLIWLAQMSHQNPEKHEDKFLKLSHNKNLRATVIAQKIHRQKSERALKPYMKELSNSPDVLAKLALEIYSQTGSILVLQEAFKYKGVQRSSSGGLIARLMTYPQLSKDIQTISQSRLNFSNQKSLKKSLEARLKLVSGFEKRFKVAIQNRDILLQAISLDVLKDQNQRLYNDLLKLPIPRGLDKIQQEKYKTLVAQQAAPYLAKSEKIESTIQKIWSDSSWINQMTVNYSLARFEFKPALKYDIQQLIKHAPQSSGQQLAQVIEEPHKVPSEKSIALVKNKIRANPFEESPIRELKELEGRRGNDLFVSHLDARLNQMKGI